jgi:hypothetical protein
MPPSPCSAGSGGRAAQRTIMNRPTIGIFRNTISHRKVQTSTLPIVYLSQPGSNRRGGGRGELQPRGVSARPLNWVIE